MIHNVTTKEHMMKQPIHVNVIQVIKEINVKINTVNMMINIMASVLVVMQVIVAKRKNNAFVIRKITSFQLEQTV